MAGFGGGGGAGSPSIFPVVGAGSHHLHAARYLYAAADGYGLRGGVGASSGHNSCGVGRASGGGGRGAVLRLITVGHGRGRPETFRGLGGLVGAGGGDVCGGGGVPAMAAGGLPNPQAAAALRGAAAAGLGGGIGLAGLAERPFFAHNNLDMYYCCWPECSAEGTFPAPKNPRDLAQRQYFCAQHIKEFNKRWNGLEGFTEGEIYTLQEPTASWQRPTWDDGLRGRSSQQTFKSAQDLYGFFNSRLARELNGEAPRTQRKLPADVQAACRIFSIEQPLAESQLKPRYLRLAKQYHPDVNKAADAAEMTKRINVAYKILLDYAARHGLGAV
jgi:hypothetical protein